MNIEQLLEEMESKMGPLPSPIHEPMRFDYYCKIFKYVYWKKS